MKLEVYHFDPEKGKEHIQTFEVNAKGEAVPTMPGDTSWASSARIHGKIVTPEDGEEFLKALADKLAGFTYMTAKLV